MSQKSASSKRRENERERGSSDGDAPLAFGVRKENPKLKAALDAFVKKVYRGTEYNMLRKRSFENKGVLTGAITAANRFRTL